MLGQLHDYKNKDATSVHAITYNRILLLNASGEFETLLITDHELARLRTRVSKNEEDIAQPSWLDKLWKTLGNLF